MLMYGKAFSTGCNLARFPAPHGPMRGVRAEVRCGVARALCTCLNWRDGVSRRTEACHPVHHWGLATEPEASRVLMLQVEQIMTCQFN